jgi:NADH-quinone oxidoreductase subunit L
MLESICIFLPIAAAAIAGLGNRRLGDRGAQAVTCGSVLVSAGIAIWLLIDVGFNHHPRTIDLFTWIDSGDLHARWSLRFDTLTAVMVAVITIVSSMVHVYSIGYMADDNSKPRFMAYLSFFTFTMLMLVTADNFVQMFFGWEGVGTASYLLINFWYERPSANNASIKAFIVNRVGDFGFILGISAVFLIFGSVEFGPVFDSAAKMKDMHFGFLGHQVNALTCACLLLFVGAMGKSAQLGLHTWLPDAMEGPTPVSALIHAATMVTAGVFMLCRCSPLFEQSPDALEVVTYVGAITAFIAATIGLTQFDIKRVIAYSTMSQLGYMFFAIGVSAYGAAMFHLMTHAFFKALLFLCAGSVIHGIGGEQDMRKMGGLRKYQPITFTMMMIGSLAIAGIGIPDVFGFAGFYSKDSILESAYASGTGQGRFAYWAGLVAALFTAFYSWRLLFMTFSGSYRGSQDSHDDVHHDAAASGHEASHDEHHHHDPHESGPIMTVPLGVLAIGAIFAGFAFEEYFVGGNRAGFWGHAIFVAAGHDSVGGSHGVPFWVGFLPLCAALTGIFAAWIAYRVKPGIPAMITSNMRTVYELVFHKYYFDEIYRFLFVRPAGWLGKLFWKQGDGTVIDGFGPNGIAFVTRNFAGRVSLAETGYVYHYAFAMIIGVVALVSWYLYRAAA